MVTPTPEDVNTLREIMNKGGALIVLGGIAAARAG
jgi:hypothetical protein